MRRESQAGSLLIELLVVSSIAALLSAAVLQLSLGSVRTLHLLRAEQGVGSEHPEQVRRCFRIPIPGSVDVILTCRPAGGGEVSYVVSHVERSSEGRSGEF
jgi:type II secretory pathway pseudopilin PulG